MADAPDPDGAKDGAKDDAAPAAATPPDQGSAMELELSQALIEVRRLTLFAGLPSGMRSLATSHRRAATGAHGSARGRPAIHAGPSRREPRCRYKGLEPEGPSLAR